MAIPKQKARAGYAISDVIKLKALVCEALRLTMIAEPMWSNPHSRDGPLEKIELP